MRSIRGTSARLMVLAAIAALALAGVGPTTHAAPPDPAFLVKDINPITGSNPQTFLAVGSTVYFTVNSQVWQSDGTDAGTTQVSVPGVTNPSYPSKIGSTLIFFDTTGTPGNETTNLVAYDPGTNTSTPLKSGFTLFSLNGPFQTSTSVFFFVGGSSTELWKTDGTLAGTVKVATLRGAVVTNPLNGSAVVGSTLYFGFDDGVNGYEVWKSDGTEAGTGLVKAVIADGANFPFPSNFTPVGGKLVFTADDGTNGRELWVTDGTSGGTFMLKDITPGSFSTFGLGSSFAPFAVAGGQAYLFTSISGNLKDLWKTDGTSAGTVLVKSLPSSSFRSGLTAAGRRVFYTDNDATNGVELWTSDGTDAGTRLVKDIIPGVAGSEPLSLANVDGTLVFAASTSATGKEVWKSDGTEAGTLPVADVNPGSDSSNPRDFTAAGSFVFFTAEGTTGNRELWAMPRSLFPPPPSYAANLPLVVAP